MVTNYPQQLAAAAEITFERTGNAVARGMARLGQMICGFSGHDEVLQFSDKKVLMRCTSCGRESPGGKSAVVGRVAASKETPVATC